MGPGNAPVVRSAAPGKVILLGEHAVVYGRTALAASIDRFVEVSVTDVRTPLSNERGDSFQDSPSRRRHRDGGSSGRTVGSLHCDNLTVLAEEAPSSQGPSRSRRAVPLPALERAAELAGLASAGIAAVAAADLPVGVGLGSSAALSVALIRALAKFAGQSLSDAAVCTRAFEIEKIFHGFPSGIDNTVVTYGGLIVFRRGDAVRPAAAARPIPLVIAIGRAPRETQQTVRGLRERWESSPALYEPLFDEIDHLASRAERAIGTGDLPTLGVLMNANHRLLQRLGVSTGELDEMVALARDVGALGAKLTGGGGGGAVICLCDAGRERLVESFTRAGWRAFATDIVPRGFDGAGDADCFEQRSFASA